MYLCLDTATPRTTVAVVALDGTLLAESAVNGADPGQVAVEQIDSALSVAKINKSELTAVVVGVGPGPYTSTRVGCVVAQTIGAVLRIPVVGACTHDAIALQVVDGRAHALAVGDDWDPHGPFVVATDARRKEVYWAIYDENGSRTQGPLVSTPAELVSVATEILDSKPAVAGGGFDRYPEFAESGVIRIVGPKHPSAHWLAHVVGVENLTSENLASVELHSSELVDHDSGTAAVVESNLVDLAARAFTPYPLYLREPDAKPTAEREAQAGSGAKP